MIRTYIILDSVKYDVMVDANPKNMLSVGDLHPATSHASWTLPSMTSILGGVFPMCKLPECKKPSHRMYKVDPWWMEHLKKYVYVFAGNPWVTIPLWQRRSSIPNLLLLKYDENCPLKKMLPEILRLHEHETNAYFFIHVNATHYPYNWVGKGIPKPIEPTHYRNLQIKMIREVDILLKEVLRKGEILITADHGDIFRKDWLLPTPHHLNRFDPELFNVFIITNF